MVVKESLRTLPDFDAQNVYSSSWKSAGLVPAGRLCSDTIEVVSAQAAAPNHADPILETR